MLKEGGTVYRPFVERKLLEVVLTRGLCQCRNMCMFLFDFNSGCIYTPGLRIRDPKQKRLSSHYTGPQLGHSFSYSQLNVVARLAPLPRQEA